jgi:lysophospholipid acyltransferase (LPLAT)-like uncharacterized protein
MKWWWRRNRPKLIGWLIYGFARLLGASLRTKVENWHETKAMAGGKILLTWHGRTYLAGQFFRNEGFWVIISHSSDGEIQNRIMQKMGYHVIRGSTGRGGERALIESIRVLRDGKTMAITPDGPRGPSGVVQGGVMAMARKSGAALVPVGISARPRILAGSWDRHQIPLPFARCLILFGAPIYVPKDADEAEVERLRLLLQSEMHRLEDEAESRLGYTPVPHPAQSESHTTAPSNDA